MDNAFKASQCCLINASDTQVVTSMYYASVRDNINSILDQIFKAEMFGLPTEEMYNQLNDFHYLYVLLMIIYAEMQDDANTNKYIGNTCEMPYAKETYIEKYNIDCIAKKFLCKGSSYDISKTLDIFDLNPNTNTSDGIDYMHIRYHSSNCTYERKEFRIF